MPQAQPLSSLTGLENRARTAALRNDCLVGSVQGSKISIVQDLHDDEIPKSLTMGPKAMQKLQMRFLDRLSLLVSVAQGEETVTIALLKENRTAGRVDIWLSSLNVPESRPHTSTSINPGLLKEISNSLKLACRDGANFEAQHQLQELIIKMYQSAIQKHIYSVASTFTHYKSKFDDLIETLFGVFDEKPNAFDYELGDIIIALREQILGINTGPVDQATQDAIMDIAIQMCRTDHSRIRLRQMLGSSALSDSLYSDIYRLASPALTFNTFLSIARVSATFTKINILNGLPTGADHSAAQATSRDSKSNMRRTNIKSTPQNQNRDQWQLQAQVVPPYDPDGKGFQIARLSLLPEERYLGLLEIQPLAKRQTFNLLAMLSENLNPGPGSEEYYVFGYTTCRNSNEMQYLGGLYRAILTSFDRDKSRNALLEEVWKALESDSLVSLFQKSGYYDSFIQNIPAAEHFLEAAPNARPSVWRLIQFLRTKGNTNPPQILQRDYGFNMCRQRDEVERLKGIYAAVIANTSPFRLHKACTDGRLLDFAITNSVLIEQKDQRLVRNEIGHPDLGFETGLFGQARLFKKG